MVGQICPGVTVWMSRLAGAGPALCQAKIAPGGTRTKLPAGMGVAAPLTMISMMPQSTRI